MPESIKPANIPGIRTLNTIESVLDLGRRWFGRQSLGESCTPLTNHMIESYQYTKQPEINNDWNENQTYPNTKNRYRHSNQRINDFENFCRSRSSDKLSNCPNSEYPRKCFHSCAAVCRKCR